MQKHNKDIIKKVLECRESNNNSVVQKTVPNPSDLPVELLTKTKTSRHTFEPVENDNAPYPPIQAPFDVAPLHPFVSPADAEGDLPSIYLSHHQQTIATSTPTPPRTYLQSLDSSPSVFPRAAAAPRVLVSTTLK